MTGESARVVAFGSFRDGRLVGLAKERDDDAGLSEPLITLTDHEAALAELREQLERAKQFIGEAMLRDIDHQNLISGLEALAGEMHIALRVNLEMPQQDFERLDDIEKALRTLTNSAKGGA